MCRPVRPHSCSSSATGRRASSPCARSNGLGHGLEREIKLRFPSAEDARTRVFALGATPLRARRLQHDVIVDTADQQLFTRGCALRVRAESGRAVLTFKGPVAEGPLKIREETETEAASADALLRILGSLGYQPVFRYEKYREEFQVPGAIVAVDETPLGTYVEIEGEADAIRICAEGLGARPADYVTASYRTLFLDARGDTAGNMVFDAPPAHS